MSTAAQRRGYAGVNKLRRTLRRLEPDAREGIRKALTEGAEAIHYDMWTTIPRDTGQTMLAISEPKISRDGLTARIGFIGKKAVEQGYVARFIEYGTKGYPKRNIPPQPARPFMRPAFDNNKDWIVKQIDKAIERTLQELASGPDDD